MIESIEGAIIFLGCSMLISAGLLIITATVVAINNLFARYWQPMNWLQFHDPRPEYIVPDVNPVEALTKTAVYKTKTKETTQ